METHSEQSTNSQDFPTAMMICSMCLENWWHTEFPIRGWRSRCCNA